MEVGGHRCGVAALTRIPSLSHALAYSAVMELSADFDKL